MKKIRIYRHAYDFSVDYDVIAVDNISDIHECYSLFSMVLNTGWIC